MLMAGAQLGFVSAQLEHTDPAITLRAYFKWLATDTDQRLEDLLEPNPPSVP